jgi:uncharacterized protein with GYD domain
MMKYTDQGVKDIKNTAQRTQAITKALEAMGGKVNALFACMGEYDLIGFGEAPNDEVATSLALMIGAQGTARTTTVKAIPMDQFIGIVKKLP